MILPVFSKSIENSIAKNADTTLLHSHDDSDFMISIQVLHGRQIYTLPIQMLIIFIVVSICSLAKYISFLFFDEEIPEGSNI